MLLVAGRIGRAHGLRGEVLIVVLTDEPENRFAPGRVLATDPESAGPLTIAAGHVHSGKLMLTFEGYPDRTAVETLRDVLLLVDVDPDELPDAEDEWYDHQLVGLDAVTASGEPLGEVREVLHLPGHDVLAVTRLDGTEVLVPFVAEIVPEIDIAGNRAVITPPPGLFEELVESDPPPAEA